MAHDYTDKHENPKQRQIATVVGPSVSHETDSGSFALQEHDNMQLFASNNSALP